MKLSERLTAQGPKRILALDGGGIRGALTLWYLGEIEQILRDRHKRPDLVLCDYFDFIGGTSTGAIIAAALAIEKTSLRSRNSIFGLARKSSPSINGGSGDGGGAQLSMQNISELNSKASLVI